MACCSSKSLNKRCTVSGLLGSSDTFHSHNGPCPGFKLRRRYPALPCRKSHPPRIERFQCLSSSNTLCRALSTGIPKASLIASLTLVSDIYSIRSSPPSSFTPTKTQGLETTRERAGQWASDRRAIHLSVAWLTLEHITEQDVQATRVSSHAAAQRKKKLSKLPNRL